MSKEIDSFLISLSYDIPTSELGRLEHFLAETQHAIASHTTSIGKELLTWQAGIIGAFTAVAAATVGMTDHVITADQQYRIMGERMMLGTQQARELSLALKATGMTLDEAMWDPLGRSEVAESVDRQQRMAKMLGGNYDEASQKLQRLKFEVMDVGSDLQYLERFIVLDILKSIGMTPDQALSKLREFHDWFIGNMPGIAQEITGDLMPVLHDWKSIMQSMVPLFEDLGLLFTNLVGLMNGDHAIEGTTFSFRQLGHAIGDVAHDFDRFVQLMILGEKMLTHFGLAAELLFQHKWGDAAKQFQSALSDLSPTTGAIVGAGIGGLAGGISGGVAGSEVPVIGNIVGAIGGAVGGAWEGGTLGLTAGVADTTFSSTNWNGADTKWVAGAENSGPGTGKNGPLNWAHAASMSGVAEFLLKAVAEDESKQRQYDKNGNIITSRRKDGSPIAYGVMQLTPDTAAEMHVDYRDGQQNLDGGAGYLEKMLKRYYGDLNLSLAAYNWGPGDVDKWRDRGERWNELPPETQKYLKNIEGSLGATPDQHINISQINIQMQKNNLSHAQLADAVSTGVTQGMKENALPALMAQQGVQR